MKYEQMNRQILAGIGEENIQDVFNCVTRLRIVVKDKESVDFEGLDSNYGKRFGK